MGLNLKTKEEVYSPREDSLLLARKVLEEVRNGDSVLDMGCGSGILGLVAAKKAKTVTAVDMNPEAVELTQENTELNSIENIKTKESDLFDNIEKRFDLIFFNSPYLPTEKKEEKIKGSEQWSGGKEGIDVIEPFLKEVKNHLKRNGRILLLISSLTGKEEVEKIITNNGFTSQTIDKKKIDWEKLIVLRITRS